MSATLRLLTQTQLKEVVPYSRSQIDRLEKNGLFPKRVRIGANRVGWLATEIEEWITDKAEARNHE